MSEPLHFDYTQYLPVFEAATFLEPRLLQRSEPLACSAFRAACKRNPEVLAFTRDWDEFDKLTLIPQAQAFEPSPLLATWKTDEMDRTLFDRRRRNAWEHRIEGASAQMSTGAQLLDVQAGPRQWAGVHFGVHEELLGGVWGAIEQEPKTFFLAQV